MDARRFRTLFSLSLAVVDAAMLSLAFVISHRLRRLIEWPAEAVELDRLSDYAGILVVVVASVQLIFFLFRLYHLVRATSRVDQFYSVVGGVTVGLLLAIALAALLFRNSVFEVNWPRMMIAYNWLAAVVLVTLGRWVFQQLRAAIQNQGWARDRVIVVGSGESAELVLQKIRNSPYLGYTVVGVVNPVADEMDASGVPAIGGVDDLPELIDRHAIDEVIVAMPDAPDDELVRLISLSHRERVSIKVFPDVYDIMAAGVSIDDLGGLPLLSIRDVALRGWKLAFKRAMDVAISAVGLILLSPFLLLAAVLIRLESRGPVIFVQERMGLDTRPFPMYKFRSMRSDAEAHGPGWTVKGDPRVTRFGSFLRKYSIDELPQLINVLLGDMSLVGPRPEQPAFVEQFRRMVPRYMERHREKAGITGWAQVNGLRGDTSIMERTKYDLWYIENWSVWLDIKILIRTVVRSVLFDRNAY